MIFSNLKELKIMKDQKEIKKEIEFQEIDIDS